MASGENGNFLEEIKGVRQSGSNNYSGSEIFQRGVGCSGSTLCWWIDWLGKDHCEDLDLVIASYWP